MPGALVRLLRVDSATRAALTEAGIDDAQPTAFIRAAPFRADCRTIRWRPDSAWVVDGDTGYARAYLTSRDAWLGDVPVFTIPHTWRYPYPRQRGLVFRPPPDARLAPAEAVYSLDSALDVGVLGQRTHAAADSLRRIRALEWLVAHGAVAELAPVRSTVRSAVLAADWRLAEAVPSRLKGSYTVTMEGGGAKGAWQFRTYDRPGYSWTGATVPTNAELLSSPHVAGYLLVRYAAVDRGSLPVGTTRPTRDSRLVWLGTEDRPTMPGNAERRLIRGRLEFQLNAAPEALWELLEAFIPEEDPRDSSWTVKVPREKRQPALPITLRIDGRGGVIADTTIVTQGRRLRVRLERVDTLSIPRTW